MPSLVFVSHLLVAPPSQDPGMREAFGVQLTLLEKKVIEGPDGQDFGVPVMETSSSGLWEFGSREALHASPNSH